MASKIHPTKEPKFIQNQYRKEKEQNWNYVSGRLEHTKIPYCVVNFEGLARGACELERNQTNITIHVQIHPKSYENEFELHARIMYDGKTHSE